MAEAKKTTKTTTTTRGKKAETQDKEVKKTTSTKSSSKTSTKGAKAATKTAPKKTVTKKVETVASEKHFCTHCGKELNEGETCNCTMNNDAISVNPEALATMGHNFITTIINMYKKPSTTLDEEVSKNDLKASMIMLVAIAISFGLYITGGFNSIMALLGNYTGETIRYIEVPYFRIFLYMTLIYFILSFIPITAAYVVSKLTNNHDFNYQKSISLYATSMAPLVFTNILMALLYYIDILSWLGGVIGMVISIACFFHYMLGYLNTNKISENKKSYALTSLVIIWIVTFMIAIVIFTGSLVSDLSNDFGIRNNNNYNDIFNW